MNTVLQTNIFFIITSVSVVLLVIVIIIALSILITVLLEIKDFVRKSKKEGEEILDDIHGLREEIKIKRTETRLFFVFLAKKVRRYFQKKFSHYHERNDEDDE